MRSIIIIIKTININSYASPAQGDAILSNWLKLVVFSLYLGGLIKTQMAGPIAKGSGSVGLEWA